MSFIFQAFKPERFLEGSAESAARHPYAYLPFGALSTPAWCHHRIKCRQAPDASHILDMSHPHIRSSLLP